MIAPVTRQAWPFPSVDALSLPGEYALVRAAGGAVAVALQDGSKACLITSHALVRQLLKDPTVSARPQAPGYPVASDAVGPLKRVQRSMVRLDASEHARLRRAVLPALTRRAISALRPQIDRIVDQEVQLAVGAGGQDVCLGFATRIPVAVMAATMGLPLSTAQDLAAESIAVASLARATESHAESGSIDPLAPFDDVFHQILRERRLATVTSRILRGLDSEGVTSEDTRAITLRHVFTSGISTVRNTIALSLLALSQFPDQFAHLLVTDDTGLQNAAGEMLRYTCVPRHSVLRASTTPLAVGDLIIPAGTGIIASIAAANRDPDVFEDPESLCLDRRPNPHLTFAPGTHGCVGGELAMLQLIAVLAATRRYARGLKTTNFMHHEGTALMVDSLTVEFQAR